MDLINRQDAVDAIGKVFYVLWTKVREKGAIFPSVTWFDGMAEAIDIIRNMPSAEPEINRTNLVRAITTGIIATNGKDIYSCGMRNGMRWCKSLLNDEEPKYEDASQYAAPEQKMGKWVALDRDTRGYTRTYKCSECGGLVMRAMVVREMDYEYCPYCGSKLEDKE